MPTEKWDRGFADCGCPKEKSVKWFNKFRKGMIIFWISSTIIAVTLTILYHLGIRT